MCCFRDEAKQTRFGRSHVQQKQAGERTVSLGANRLYYNYTAGKRVYS